MFWQPVYRFTKMSIVYGAQNHHPIIEVLEARKIYFNHQLFDWSLVFMVNEQDETLIGRCLGGDKQAFSALITKYQKAIFNVALRLTGDYDEAKDVVQTVFIRVYERLRDYDPKFKFFSWIYKMTVNESLNRIDRRKRTMTLDETIESSDRGPDEQLEERDLQEAVQDAIAELPIDGRVLLILRHFTDLSYRELGYILDVPEKTVKSRLFSARQRLGEIIRKQGVIQYD